MFKGPNSVYEIDTEILKILSPFSDEEKYELFHHLFSRYCEVIPLPKSGQTILINSPRKEEFNN